MKYVFVDDSAQLIGGTSLTLQALTEPRSEEVLKIPTNNLSMMDVLSNLDKVWIFGNIHSISKEFYQNVIYALSMTRFFKIEFDYGYCMYRGRIPHLEFTGKNCDCHKNNTPYTEIYELIKSRSIANFYMSKEQMDFHIEDLSLDRNKCHILSSCFVEKFYDNLKELSSRPKNNKYAIVDGQGGWHTKAKGVPNAIEFAKSNSIKYDLISSESHKELMEQLSAYKGLIFLPIIHDTCPRLVIEAKLLGLDLKINKFCQHITEDWWNRDNQYIISYLKSRPKFLWDKIDELSN
jgi:hypothetical protein